MHVPFCAASCPYCDYPHAVASSSHAAFVQALCVEIDRRARFHGAAVATIYLGGGTPSQLSPAHLERILEALRSKFDCAGTREVTLEANPDDLDASFLQAARALGVNRLSLGVQSFFAGDLRFLGRRHDAEQSARAVPHAHAAGFENVNVDLLFGLPGQSAARWQATLEQAVQQRPTHVTLYRLTAEAGTPLGRRVRAGTVALPSDEAASAQYEQALDVLEGAGFHLYEQTHLAREGFAAQHTPRYWRHAPVLGFGPGAHSFFWKDDGTAVRRANAPDWHAYVEALSDKNGPGTQPPHTQQPLATGDLADEYIALRLRTARGLPPLRLAERYGRALPTGPSLDRLLAEGYVEWHAGRLRATRAGRLRLDALTAALL